MATKPTEMEPVEGIKVRPIDWEEIRGILRPKFDAGDHWIIVAHILAFPVITTIEQRYYLGGKNGDFTLVTAFWRGQMYVLVAARKRWMRDYQLASILRQMTGLKISDAEVGVKDLFVSAPDVEDATALAAFLFDRQELAIAA
jgi:hypothetical protein